MSFNINLLYVLAVFVILKVAGVITCSWLWILAPIVLVGALVALCLLYAMVITLLVGAGLFYAARTGNFKIVAKDNTNVRP